jgi:multidrug resistance efflux pump
VASIADVTRLRLVVNVEQKDIRHVQLNQQAEITVYGLTDMLYQGVVERIAPQGATGAGSILFPVTIRFVDDSLTHLKPGMSATATFLVGEQAEEAAAEEGADAETVNEEATDEASTDEETADE